MKIGKGHVNKTRLIEYKGKPSERISIDLNYLRLRLIEFQSNISSISCGFGFLGIFFGALAALSSTNKDQYFNWYLFWFGTTTVSGMITLASLVVWYQNRHATKEWIIDQLMETTRAEVAFQIEEKSKT